jgi:hypothetical protein
MNDAKLKSYLDAWTRVSNSTPETVAAMVAGAHPQIRFTDVNSPNVHEGHDGIRRICELATALHPGARIEYDALLCDGRNWSTRWTMTRTMEDGSAFHRRGASAGRLAPVVGVLGNAPVFRKPGFPGA